jgi:hypothetical protein
MGGERVALRLDYRSRTITHEMMHYLVRRTNGGKPRDKWENVCDGADGDNNKCYGVNGAVELAFHDRMEAVMNVDNYKYWMRDRFRRWGRDWPPHTDNNAGDPLTFQPPQRWHNDPISDDDWPMDVEGRLKDVGWGWIRDYMKLLVDDRNWEPWE